MLEFFGGLVFGFFFGVWWMIQDDDNDKDDNDDDDEDEGYNYQ